MKKGFTFMEVLFSMVIFMVIFATFAMVFPNGYHLNLKSYRWNQAIDLADAIVQEIAAKPYYSPPGGPNGGDSMSNLTGWASECPRTNGIANCGCDTTPGTAWTPQALCNFYTESPNLAAQHDYALNPLVLTPGIAGSGTGTGGTSGTSGSSGSSGSGSGNGSGSGGPNGSQAFTTIPGGGGGSGTSGSGGSSGTSGTPGGASPDLAPGGTANTPGIVVTFISGGNPSNIGDNPLVQIVVNLTWIDDAHGAPIPRAVMIRSFASYDR